MRREAARQRDGAGGQGGAGCQPRQLHEEAEFGREQHAGRRHLAFEEVDGEHERVGLVRDVHAHRADQRLELADAPDGDLQVRTAQRGEQQRVEGLDGEQVEEAQRDGRLAGQFLRRQPQAEVLAGGQPVPGPREQIGRQLRAPQQFVGTQAEVGHHDPIARQYREAVHRRNCPVSTSC